MDNNDLKIDMITGNASGSHQTNVIYMQRESDEEESNNGSKTAQNVTKKEVSKELNVKCKELTNVQQYVCPQGAGTEPPVKETVAQPKRGQRSQIIRSVVHALARTSFSGERPSVKQQTKHFLLQRISIMPSSLHSKKQSLLPCYIQ